MDEHDIRPGTISQEGHQRPSLKFLNRYVRSSVGLKWHDLGIELLDCDDTGEMDTIEAEHPTDVKKCCTKMFSMWLMKQPSASWNQLIEALKQPDIQLGTLAAKVEQMLLGPKPKDKEKIGQERHKNIDHSFNASSETSGSSFGDASRNFGVGQATATGGGHGSMGRSVDSYEQQAQQKYHSVIRPSQQSFGANSNTPPQLPNMLPQRNYVQPYYPSCSSGSSMSYIGLKDCVTSSRPNENTTTTTTLKCMESSASGGSRVAQLNGQLDKQAEGSGSTDVAEDDAIMRRQRRHMAAYQLCVKIFDVLMDWARTKDVRYLLAIQGSLKAVLGSDGDTFLHVAIINQQKDIVTTLLDILPTLPASEPPIVDCLNNFKQTPLHLSVITRQYTIVEQLLVAGANPLVCDRNGNTALHLSAHMGYPEAMKCLLERKTHLVTAPNTLHTDVLIMNINGHTPVHLAALCGSIDCLKLLHQAGVNLDVQEGKSGHTALHYAVEKSDIALCSYLLVDVGGNVDQSDYSGNTPLHVAASLGNTQLINLLVNGGADRTVKNLEEETPLDLAKQKGHNEAVRVLENITSEDHHDQENSQQVVVQSTSVSAVTSNVPTSSIIKTENNMNLDYMTRIKLSLLLDGSQYGKDWKELCILLGLEPLLSTFSTVSSPTQELLNYYEANGGTNSQLRSCLIKMCRNDCVTIIDNDTGHLPLHSNTQQQPSNAGKIKMSCDSGISAHGGAYPTRRKV